MMNYHLFEMPQDKFTAVKAGLEAISDDLSFLIPPRELALFNPYKVSYADIEFIRQALAESENTDLFIPGFCSTEKIRSQLVLGGQLENLQHHVDDLSVVLRKNRVAAYSEAYRGSSSFYRILERAKRAGIPKASFAYDRLSEHHLKRRHS